MNKLGITTAAALAALTAVYTWGAWVYEDEWRERRPTSATARANPGSSR